MAHQIEFIDGVPSIAYSGETPWHSLGKRIPADLTPEQICEASGTNWQVEKRPSTVTLNGAQIETGGGVLVRVPNGKNIRKETILTNLPDINNWFENQNSEAFSFFNDFVKAGDMEMHTAGSLKNGKIVWALAKVKESFTVVGKKDEVESYLLFSNPHQYGKAISVLFTPTRVVCNNTLTMALGGADNGRVNTSHRTKFDADEVKEKLGIAHEKLAQYKEAAQFLASKKYKEEDVVEYFNRIFPVLQRDPTKDYVRGQQKEMTKAAEVAAGIVETQPGHQFAPGTFWNLMQAATFTTNHVVGRSDDTRVASLWYGASRATNTKALNVALEMAS
jgi:phage/plasmid-like protein (TIGR03299 family)